MHIGLPELLIILVLLVGAIWLGQSLLKRRAVGQRVNELEREVAELKSRQKS